MASLTIRGKGQVFKKDDDYMTPKSAWEAIRAYIPKDKLIWEAFHGDGTSATHLRSMGFNVISGPMDFFEYNFGDIIVTNPPYSNKAKILHRLWEINKPFILIVPTTIISKAFFKNIWAEKCGIIVPSKRIHFVKNGEQTSRSWFDVIYLCYNIAGVKPREIVYLWGDLATN
tara:strand:- start:9 stop:524 length:516 start_codon:yes stop_codon:yes gene_type:complete